jgi:hypothetical protein
MNVWRPSRSDQIDEKCGERWWWFPLARAGEIRLLDRMSEEQDGGIQLSGLRPDSADPRHHSWGVRQRTLAADFGRRLLAERLANQTERIRRFIASDLDPGLSIEEAGQRYCVWTSPELFHLLTVEMTWAVEQHQRWVTQLMRTELLEMASE